MNVLIVEDDQFLLNSTVEGIDWEALSVDHVFTANNGFQAKEILGQYEIALIVTDIEMPGMSGLELIRWIQEQQMDCKCILLSAHASFSYAQEAIRLQSSQYLLKPISAEELFAVISRELGNVRKKKAETLTDLARGKQRFWMEYVEKHRQGTEDKELEERGKRLYGEKRDFFVLLLLESETGNRPEPWNGEMKGHRYMDVAKEAWADLTAHAETVMFWCRKQWALVGIAETESIEELADRFAVALEQRGMKESVFYFEEKNISATACFEELDRLSEVALRAVTETILSVNAAEWERRRTPDLETYYSQWKQEIKATDRLEELCGKMLVCVERECRQARVTKDVFVRLRMILSQILFNWLERQKLQQFMFFDEDEFKENYENSVHSLENMQKFISWMFERMKGYSFADSPKSSIVRKIKTYVEEHLGDDMSRKDIADFICLSENYVSTIFSEETGENLPGYIARRRMEKAKEYLRNTDWVVSRISVEVGYTNFSYFSKVFKEHTGRTPNEYRKGKML